MNKAELLVAIAAIAAEKGIEAPDTTDKTNAELEAILDGLKDPKPPEGPTDETAAVAARKAEYQANMLAKAEARAKAEKAAREKKPPFTIAQGKALTTLRGILGAGKEIKAEDLPGGKEALKDFVERGYVNAN